MPKGLKLDEDTEDHLSLKPNEKASKHDSEIPVGKLYFSMPKMKQHSARYRNNDYLKNYTITDFITNIHNIIQKDIKDSFYKIRTILNSF